MPTSINLTKKPWAKAAVNKSKSDSRDMVSSRSTGTRT